MLILFTVLIKSTLAEISRLSINLRANGKTAATLKLHPNLTFLNEENKILNYSEQMETKMVNQDGEIYIMFAVI